MRKPLIIAATILLSLPVVARTGEPVGVWTKTLRRAKVPYFWIYNLRSTYGTRLRAGDMADEWVTQLLRRGDSQVFKWYSQIKRQMKREALGR